MNVCPSPCVRFWPVWTLAPHRKWAWGRVKNGELLKRAEGVFDVFVTAKNLKYQQNLTGRRLAILVLSTNRWPRVRAKTSEIIAAIQAMRPGEYVELSM